MTGAQRQNKMSRRAKYAVYVKKVKLSGEGPGTTLKNATKYSQRNFIFSHDYHYFIRSKTV